MPGRRPASGRGHAHRPGKSLCYHLAVIEGGAAPACPRAVKPVSPGRWRRTRWRSCWSSTAPASGHLAYTFDDDDARRHAPGGCVHGDIVSNPDIPSGHPAAPRKWGSSSENPRFAVMIDEHTYRGVRLAWPTSCGACSASPPSTAPRRSSSPARLTIGNPQEHVEALLGAEVQAITDSGAPRGERHVLLWIRRW